MLYVDQPVGVGFSPAGKNVTTSTQAAIDMEAFLIKFFEIYSSLRGNRFYITGESYAGHYLPALAAQLIANKSSNGINVSGIALGNGLVNPYYHVISYPVMGYSVGILDNKLYDDLKAQAE